MVAKYYCFRRFKIGKLISYLIWPTNFGRRKWKASICIIRSYLWSATHCGVIFTTIRFAVNRINMDKDLLIILKLYKNGGCAKNVSLFVVRRPFTTSLTDFSKWFNGIIQKNKIISKITNIILTGNDQIWWRANKVMPPRFSYKLLMLSWKKISGFH